VDRNVTVSSTGGVGVAGLLGLLFVALKLIGIITWSWWWVTAPFWIPFALAVAVAIVAGIVLVLVLAYGSWDGV